MSYTPLDKNKVGKLNKKKSPKKTLLLLSLLILLTIIASGGIWVNNRLLTQKRVLKTKAAEHSNCISLYPDKFYEEGDCIVGKDGFTFASQDCKCPTDECPTSQCGQNCKTEQGVNRVCFTQGQCGVEQLDVYFTGGSCYWTKCWGQPCGERPTPTGIPITFVQLTPTPTTPVTVTPTPTTALLNCFEPGCTRTPCKAGLVCVQSFDYIYGVCSLPENQTKCAEDPTYERCCGTIPTITPTPTKKQAYCWSACESQLWSKCPVGLECSYDWCSDPYCEFPKCVNPVCPKDNDCQCLTPTPKLTVTPTPTKPTNTPTPTSTPGPTNTPPPGPSYTPTPTPISTNTPIPTEIIIAQISPTTVVTRAPTITSVGTPPSVFFILIPIVILLLGLVF